MVFSDGDKVLIKICICWKTTDLQNWWVSWVPREKLEEAWIGEPPEKHTGNRDEWTTDQKKGSGRPRSARTEDNVSSVSKSWFWIRKGNHRHIVPYARFPEKSAYRSRLCYALSMMTSVWNAWRSDTCTRAHSIKSSCSPAMRQKAAANVPRWQSGLYLVHQWESFHGAFTEESAKWLSIRSGRHQEEAGRGWASVAYANNVQSVGVSKLGFTDLIFVDPGVTDG